MIPVELLLTQGTDRVMNTALSVLEREFSLSTTVTRVSLTPAMDVALASVDDFFEWMRALRPQVEAFLVLLVPVRLVTVLGYEIVAETRVNRIVIATTKLTPKTLPRVLRHGIGQVMGLEDHWGCVMSRSYVENATFCIDCRAALLKRGIGWRADPSQPTLETTQSS